MILFLSKIRKKMRGKISSNMVFVFLSVVSIKVWASPITSEQYEFNRKQTSISDPLFEFYEQTKNLGQQAMDRISNTALGIGTTIGDFASELFQQGTQHTAGLFASGHEIIVDNFEQVKKFGEESLNFLKKAVTDTSTFFTDNVPQFPFIAFNSGDDRRELNARKATSFDNLTTNHRDVADTKR